MSLPFFGQAAVEIAPQIAVTAIEPGIEAVDMPADFSDRERLEEILDELTGLKARLQAARKSPI